MDEEKIINLISICFDGNEDKIKAFLDFFNLVSYQNVNPINNVKMVLPEDCMYETKEQDCLLEFPDSVDHCKQPCNFYVSCDSIRKLSEGGKHEECKNR